MFLVVLKNSPWRYVYLVHEFPDDPEARRLHVFRLSDKDTHGVEVHPASEVSECGVLLIFIVAVYYIKALVELFEELRQLRRMSLHIIVHAYNSVAFGLVQTCHHGVMLSRVHRKLNYGDVVIFISQSMKLAHSGAVVRRAVVNEHELERSPAHFIHLFCCAFYYLSDRM